MYADPERTPVIVGVGQSIEREELVDPVDLAEIAAGAADKEAPGVLPLVDRISMVGVSFSKTVARPVETLAKRLGLHGAMCEISSAGGSLPQWLINRASHDIASGKMSTTLIVGAEATRSMRAADPKANFLEVANANIVAERSGGAIGPPMKGILGRSERSIQLVTPSEFYPMIENILAAKEGRDHDGQRAYIAPLMSRFSKVAADNPFAWFRTERSADDIAGITPENRLISEPYTRCMNSFPNCDQGAALLITSLKIARELQVVDQGVFPWTGANLEDLQPCMRPDLDSSQALSATGRIALSAAGIDSDDLAHIDFYSCFPIAVELASNSLGININDERNLTVTGGLPFFGGPGNNYSTHAVAAMVEKIRECGGIGYVSANGGYFSKHSVGIYASTPPKQGFLIGDNGEASRLIQDSSVPIAENPSGNATVDASTVTYDRNGEVKRAPIIATLDDGHRTAALADTTILHHLANVNLVGESVRIGGSPPTYWI